MSTQTINSANMGVNSIREQAANWILSLEEADPMQHDSLLRECEVWQAEHPQHRKVFRQMQQMWSAVDPVKKQARKRRSIISLTGIVLAVAVCTQIPWQYFNADYRSIAGEIRSIKLQDGSEAILNTNSAINVNYSDGVRQIELVRGEVLVNVVPDKSRSFSVETAHASARALGTRYSVREANNTTRVNVLESRVEVDSKIALGNPVILKAGQQLTVDSSKISSIDLIDTSDPDWASKQLIFNDDALVDVVQRLSDYHRGKIFLSSELISRDLRFTGVLPANDSAAAISILSKSLQLTTQTWSSYIVSIE